MATPPFGVNTSVPADNDIVSQFPAVNRSDKDQLQSWLLIDHDTSGEHVTLHMPYQSSAPTTPAASVGVLYLDVNGNLVVKRSDGFIYYIGVPPGTVAFSTSATPDTGWAVANGQAISRTGIGAALFAKTGTAYGVGDGVNTFNVIDITGRYILGKEGTVTRVTAAGWSGTSTVMGSIGGVDSFGLTALYAAPLNVTVSGTITVTSGNSNIVHDPGIVSSNAGGGANKQLSPSASAIAETSTGFNTLNGNTTNAGGAAHPQIPPSIVLQPVVKL